MSYGPYSDIVAALRVEAGGDDHRGAGGLCRDAAAEIARLRAVILNIQALAEKGFPIDTTKLAVRCRRALSDEQGAEK